MTDRTALFRAVLADRWDDAPRLVFADWLDEHGESALAALHPGPVQAGPADLPDNEVILRLFAAEWPALLIHFPSDWSDDFGQV